MVGFDGLRAAKLIVRTEGVKMENACVPVKRDHSVNTYLKNFNCPVNGVSEQSECSEAKHCEASERCERTNVASDRVAR